jgi:hypothetical protein
MYSLTNIIRIIKAKRIRWVWHVTHMVETINTYKILIAKPEGKRRLRRHRHKWEDYIKIVRGEKMVGGCGSDSSGSG